jgi:hypothetical protein
VIKTILQKSAISLKGGKNETLMPYEFYPDRIHCSDHAFNQHGPRKASP